MPSSDDPRLNEMLLRWEELHEQGHCVSIEELCADTPELTGELCRRIGALISLEGAMGSTIESVGLQYPANTRTFERRGARSIADFQDLRFYAEGALGEVFRARHAELNREVALKFLKHARADDAESKRRFIQEAEITGRLEHPGIVPVYAIGKDERGHPCYVMRFIKGQTLHEAIAAFHAAEGPNRDRSERSKALRGLLRRFVSVCNTIAYAHSRGVLHRDIKPKNVMLGKYDETLVLDWGLATPFERTDTYRDINEETLKPGSGDSGANGSLMGGVGTPQYMSPEQAEGFYELVGPASDIYSLGVMLYVVMVGQAPFDGRDLTEVLEKVRKGTFLTPRQVKPEIPRPLEAICLKAMCKNIEGRYAKALELADDLERWMADEPVSAWPEPWTHRLGRWIRRHETSAVAAVLLSVSVIILSVIGLDQYKTASERDMARSESNRARVAEGAMHRLLADKIVESARSAASRGSWDKALENYDKYLAEGHPKTREVLLGRVAALVSLNRERDALAELRAFRDPDDDGDQDDDGRVLLWMSDLENDPGVENSTNVQLIREALKKGLPPADSAYAEGLLAESSPEAVTHFERAIDLDPLHVRASERLATLYILLGRHEDARELIDKARVLFPDDANPHLLRGLLLALDGDRVGADAQVAKARAGTGGELASRWESLLRLAHNLSIASRSKGESLDVLADRITRSYAAELPEIMKVLSSMRQGVGSRTMRACDPPPYIGKHLRALIPALAAARSQDQGALIHELEALIAVHPEGTLHTLHGSLLHIDKRFEEAEKAFLLGVDTPSVFPIRPLALFGAIVAQRNLLAAPSPPSELKARTARTIRRYMALGEIAPALAPELVLAADRAGEPDLARSILAEWEKTCPNDELACATRARIELSAGSPGRALVLARALLERRPDHREYKTLLHQASEELRRQASSLEPGEDVR